MPGLCLYSYYSIKLKMIMRHFSSISFQQGARVAEIALNNRAGNCIKPFA